MILLLLTFGSLLLKGLSLQQWALLAQTASETQAIRDTAVARSTLQWRKRQVWPAQLSLACREQMPQSRCAYLCTFDSGSLLFNSVNGGVQVWQSGGVHGRQMCFSAHD